MLSGNLSPPRSHPPPTDSCNDGSVLTAEAGYGGDASSAAAPLAPQRCFSPRSAAHGPPGSPQRDLPSVPLQDWTGDRPGHCYSHHGDLPDHTSHAGNGHCYESYCQLPEDTSCAGLKLEHSFSFKHLHVFCPLPFTENWELKFHTSSSLAVSVYKMFLFSDILSLNWIADASGAPLVLYPLSVCLCPVFLYLLDTLASIRLTQTFHFHLTCVSNCLTLSLSSSLTSNCIFGTWLFY